MRNNACSPCPGCGLQIANRLELPFLTRKAWRDAVADALGYDREFIRNFDDDELVTIVENPPILSQNVTIFYKYCVGSYSNVSQVLNDVVSILPKECTTLFIIFYDKQNFICCQSAVGCIYEIDKKPLFEENYALQLTRWGFEKMVLQPTNRAIYCKQQYSSIFSSIHLSKIRSSFYNFPKKNQLNVNCAIEVSKKFADGKQYIELYFPLDNVDDFFIPKFLSKDQFDSKIARKKFDSEESDSESETELYYNEDDFTSVNQLEDNKVDVVSTTKI